MLRQSLHCWHFALQKLLHTHKSDVFCTADFAHFLNQKVENFPAAREVGNGKAVFADGNGEPAEENGDLQKTGKDAPAAADELLQNAAGEQVERHDKS